MSFTLRLLVAAALLGCAGPAQARKPIGDLELDGGSGSRVELASVFDPPPPSGYAPLRIVATNRESRDSRFSVSVESTAQEVMTQHRHSSEFGFSVGPRAAQRQILMVPVAVGYGLGGPRMSQRFMRITVRASGGKKEFQHYGACVSGFPAIAISKVLADNAITRLENEVESRMKTASMHSGEKIFGSRFENEDLPEDWRGLSGFDFLMISHTDWQSLRPGARLAVAQWVRLGGHLHLYMGPGATAAALELPQDILSGSRPMSLGAATMISWDGKYLPTGETLDRYWDARERVKELTASYTDPGSNRWTLPEKLGKRSFSSWQVLVFLVIFGILVGPVNLFVLAPSSRRHRLFITTPLLSLGASAVMIGILLFQDGVGGIGRRFVVVNLEPAETAAYVTQEQISRTGFLSSSTFALKQAALAEPVALPNNPWAKLKHTADSQAADLQDSGPQLSGNYFQSRSEQGQLLRAVIPTRARLEIKSGAPVGETPQLISALGFAARELFYVDAAGGVWKCAAGVETGHHIAFEKSSLAALKTWWAAACKMAGPWTRERLALQISKPRNMFFAKASRAPDFVLDTLTSIQWSDDEVVVFGTMPKP